MPALTIPSPPGRSTASPTASAQSSDPPESEAHHERHCADSESPDRPPVSPITPTTVHASLAAVDPVVAQARVVPPLEATFMRQPPAVPISESENPDAIALRSAISLLQLQREKSKQDLKTLEELKGAAIADPQGFARHIQAQQSQRSRSQADLLTPTLSGISDMARDVDGAGDKERRKDSASADSLGLPESNASSKFAAVPQPQNIIRCPPVNWAKYNILSAPLDKMHEDQKRYPYASEPPRNRQGGKAPPHAVAAPYSPFVDQVGETRPTESRKTSKKSSARPSP